MQVPTTRLFTAGEVLTGATLNQTITSTSNFLLGKPLARLIRTASTTVAAAGTALSWGGEDLDRDNGHSNVTNNSRYTANTPGWYLLTGSVQFGSNTTGTVRAVNWRKNGTDISGSGNQIRYSTVPSGLITLNCAPTLVYLTVGDYVDMFATHDASASITCNSGSGAQAGFMQVEWVSL